MKKCPNCGYCAPSRNADRDAKIVEAYLSGLTIRGIGNRFGVSRELVRRAVKKEGIPARPRGRKTDPEREAEIIRMRVEQKMTPREIADHFGLTAAGVHNALS